VNDEVSTDELIHNLRTIALDLNNKDSIRYNCINAADRLQAENDSLKNSDFNPTFCRLLISELKAENEALKAKARVDNGAWEADNETFKKLIDQKEQLTAKIEKAAEYMKAIDTGKLDKGSCITMANAAIKELEAQ